MDTTEVARLASLPGVDDGLLSRLALTNPTLLQLQLLRSAEAIQHFVHQNARGRVRVDLADLALDDATRAALALLQPTDSQLSLLLNEECVRSFIGLAGGSTTTEASPSPSAECNVIATLYRMAAPRQPSFQWLPAAAGYCAEYRMGELVGTGTGNTKRLAKDRAALALTRALSVPQH